MGCSSSQKISNQKMEKELTIELVSSTQNGKYFDFNLVMKNNTNNPVTILKHKGLNERGKNDEVIASAFYQMDFFPYEITCEYAPDFMDQEIEASKIFNMTSDFVTIGSKEKYLFNVKSKDYLLGICDENSREFKLVIKYEPKEIYFQKEYFDSNYKSSKNAQQYFEKFEDTFQSIITSDTLVIKY